MEEQIMDIDEVGANERVFNECVEVNANYDWSSKYKPIKPRYSNKVKMGFDWNRHNQAHYTSDNLPPKTIQGYRFNIFYPYLVDKTKIFLNSDFSDISHSLFLILKAISS